MSPQAKEKKTKTSRLKKVLRRIFDILTTTLLIVFFLFTVLVLLIRSEWGQNIIVGKVTQYVAEKTHTTFTVKKLFLTFSGRLELQDVYLEDQKGDTLLYSHKLQMAVPLKPLIKSKSIALDRLDWEGLTAHIYRKDSLGEFNYQFLLDAFASDEKKEEAVDSVAAEPYQFSVGRVRLSDFKIDYTDPVQGLKAGLKLNQFHFTGEQIDLDQMVFKAGDILLKDAVLSYEQSKPFPESDTTATTLPFIGVEELLLQNVRLKYNSTPGGIDFDGNIRDFLVRQSAIDLPGSRLSFKQIYSDQNDLFLTLTATPAEDIVVEETDNQPQAFAWPDWEVNAADLELKDNHLKFQNGALQTSGSSFDPAYLNWEQLNLKLTDFTLSKDQILQADLKNYSFHDPGGFELRKAAFSIALNPSEADLKDLVVETRKSSLNGNLNLKYRSVDELISQFEKTQLSVAVPRFLLDINELFYFVPSLKENEYVRKASRNYLSGRASARGSLSHLNLSDILINWGRNTRISGSGILKNLTQPDNLQYQFSRLALQSLKSDVLNFVAEEDLAVNIPDTIALEGSFSGSPTDYKTDARLTTSDGHIYLTGAYNSAQSSFNADITEANFDLGKLLDISSLGTVAFQAQADGKGESLGDLTLDFTTEFSDLILNGYDFSSLRLSGSLVEGEGEAILSYTDENLSLNSTSRLQLDNDKQLIVSDFNIDQAHLKKLQLIDKSVLAKLQMTTEFVHDQGDLSLKVHIAEGIARYNSWDHKLGEVFFEGSLKDEETSFDIESNFLNGNMSANANIDDLKTALQRQFRRYFVDSVPPLAADKEAVHLQASLKLNKNDVINNVFLPEIYEMDTLSFDVDFSQQEDLLTASINLPRLDYEGNILNELFFNLNATADSGEFILGFENLDVGSFGMYRTFLNGDLQDGMLTANFFAFDENDEIFYSAHSETTGKRDQLSFHLLPQNLMINREDWRVDENNEIRITKDSIIATNFDLYHQDQHLKIANDLIDFNRRPHIGLGLENYELNNFLALFNPDNDLASGMLQGKLIVVNPRGKIGLLGSLDIAQLQIMSAPLGDLSFRGFSRDTDNYRFKLELKGDDTDVEAAGSYLAKENNQNELDLQVDLNKIGFATIAQLSNNELQDAGGDLKGKFTVTGTLNKPEYDGFLQFDKASFRVTQTNSVFKLTDEKILINNYGIIANHFVIEDEFGSGFLIDGAVLTKNWSNPEFDLKLRTENFNLTNSTSRDNDTYYGKLNFDLFGYIQGKMSTPDVYLKMDINKSTDFTYVYGNTQAGMEDRSGIVEFIDKSNPDPVFVRRDSTFIDKMKGIQLQANVEIDPGARFKVIIDPRTGDNVEISGEAALNYRITPNGNMTLTGRYVIDKGHYKMNLYNLVSREFDLRKGSKITWNGDPLDADLDISAVYEAKTSAAGLMAARTGVASSGSSSQYNRRLPFEVYLNIAGTIDQPDLSFKIDLPEEERGAFGGEVYGKLGQINEDQGELNRQVFSLLVLRQFFPESGSDGSSGGFAGVARDNLTDALADQLSAFSDQLLGDTGVRLDFGLDSYTDQTAQQRTNLNINAEKSLFNDRLIVRAGTGVNLQGDQQPGEGSPLLGNVSIEYLLTDDGRWKIRGFRNDEYDNIIDGQVFVNGIALIFQRDFTRLNYLWRSFIGDPEKYYARKREEREKQKEKEMQKEATEQKNETEKQENQSQKPEK